MINESFFIFRSDIPPSPSRFNTWNPLGTTDDKENQNIFISKTAPGTPIIKSFSAAVTLIHPSPSSSAPPPSPSSNKKVTFNKEVSVGIVEKENKPQQRCSTPKPQRSLAALKALPTKVENYEIDFSRFEGGRSSFIASYNNNAFYPVSPFPTFSSSFPSLFSFLLVVLPHFLLLHQSSTFLRKLDEEDREKAQQQQQSEGEDFSEATTPRRNSIYGGAMRVVASTPQTPTSRPTRVSLTPSRRLFPSASASSSTSVPTLQPAPTHQQQQKPAQQGKTQPQTQTQQLQQHPKSQQRGPKSPTTANTNKTSSFIHPTPTTPRSQSMSLPRRRIMTDSSSSSSSSTLVSHNPVTPVASRLPPSTRLPAPSSTQKQTPSQQKSTQQKTQLHVPVPVSVTPPPRTPSSITNTPFSSSTSSTFTPRAQHSTAKVFCTPARRPQTQTQVPGSSTSHTSSHSSNLQNELQRDPFVAYLRCNTPARVESYSVAISKLSHSTSTSLQRFTTSSTSSTSSVIPASLSTQVSSHIVPLPRQDSTKRRLAFNDNEEEIPLSPSSYAEAVNIGITIPPITPNTSAPNKNSGGSGSGSGGKKRRNRRKTRGRSSASSLEGFCQPAPSSHLLLLQEAELDLGAQIQDLDKTVEQTQPPRSLKPRNVFSSFNNKRRN
jgi:hypothetical protein